MYTNTCISGISIQTSKSCLGGRYFVMISFVRPIQVVGKKRRIFVPDNADEMTMLIMCQLLYSSHAVRSTKGTHTQDNRLCELRELIRCFFSFIDLDFSRIKLSHLGLPDEQDPAVSMCPHSWQSKDVSSEDYGADLFYLCAILSIPLLSGSKTPRDTKVYHGKELGKIVLHGGPITPIDDRNQQRYPNLHSYV